MPPKRPDLVLATDIPDGELDVLVFDGFNIEAYWRLVVSILRLLKSRTCFDAPIVGIVVTISPSFNLYKIVVLPAASRPTIKMRISFFPHNRSKSFENVRPIVADSPARGWRCGFVVEKRCGTRSRLRCRVRCQQSSQPEYGASR